MYVADSFGPRLPPARVPPRGVVTVNEPASLGQPGELDPRLAHLGEALARIEQKGLKRRHRLVEPATAPGREQVVVHGERSEEPLIHLCSNDYLGLATDEHVLARAGEALQHYGAGATASRLVTGHGRVHAELEAKLAALKGQEAALVFPTGYAANLGVLTALASKRDWIFADELNHASLIDGCRLCGATVRRYPHNNVARLREMLAEESPRVQGRLFLVTDGVFSMDGDLAPLRALAELAEAYRALLIVDDAHGTGILGEGGAGTAELFGLHARPGIIHVGTLSKALGAQGGFVAGPRVLIEYLLNTARSHIFTTGLAPATAAAAGAALEMLEREPSRRERLAGHARRLREGLKALGYTLAGQDCAAPAGVVTPIVPVLVGEAEAAVRLSERLVSYGILAVPIRPPAVPPGSARIRLTVMATHSEAQIERALAAFAAVRNEVQAGGADA